MLALLPLLALVASTSLAVPLDGRQESTNVDGGVYNSTRNCNRRFRGHHSQSVSSSIAPVVSSSAIGQINAVNPSSVKSTSSAKATSAKSTSTSAKVMSSAVKSTSTSAKATSTSAKATSTSAKVTSTSTKVTSSAPSSSASSGTGSGSGSTGSAELDQALQIQNDFRKQYGAGPLTWNTTLAQHAQSVSSTCKFAHSGTKGMGENLAAGVGGGWTAATGVNGWNAEASSYDYNNPVFSSSTGHFTQVVWKSTTQVGCAVVDCPVGSIFDPKYNAPNRFLTCNYYTPGNYAGQFTANVGKKVA